MYVYEIVNFYKNKNNFKIKLNLDICMQKQTNWFQQTYIYLYVVSAPSSVIQVYFVQHLLDSSCCMPRTTQEAFFYDMRI